MAAISARDREKKHELYYMAIALLSERRSKDPVRKVGACIVDEREGRSRKENEGRVIGIGYNGMPLNCRDELMPWTEESPDKEKLKNLYVVHAEANAIVNMNPQSVADCAIYVTLHPCCECAKKLIQGGVSKVVYLSFDKCYKRKKPFQDSENFLQTMKDNKEIKYTEFAGNQEDKMILEIRFESPEEEPSGKEPPQKIGSHSVWWPKQEQNSENGSYPQKPLSDSDVIEYKLGYKYIGKKIELLKKGEIPDDEYPRTPEECKQIWKNKSIEEKLERISWEQYFMGMAILAGDLMGSEPHEGACVVNKDKRITKLGYFRIIGEIKGSKKKLGVHAPVTAIVNRGPVSLRDCTLYVTRFPCNECAKAIVQAGITTVVYLDGRENTGEDNTEGEDTGEDDPEEENARNEDPEGENTDEENTERVNTGEKNTEGENARNENLEGGNSGDKNPGGCAEQQVKVKAKNVFLDPTEKMFDLSKVKCVSYKDCYKTDPVILDFSKSKL